MPCGGRRDAVARRAGLRPATEPVSGLREDPRAACRDCRRHQYRPYCRMARRAPAGQDAHLPFRRPCSCLHLTLWDTAWRRALLPSRRRGCHYWVVNIFLLQKLFLWQFKRKKLPCCFAKVQGVSPIDSLNLFPDSRYFLEPSKRPLRTKIGVRQQYPPVIGTRCERGYSAGTTCTEPQSTNERRLGGEPGSFWTAYERDRLASATGATLLMTPLALLFSHIRYTWKVDKGSRAVYADNTVIIVRL